MKFVAEKGQSKEIVLYRAGLTKGHLTITKNKDAVYRLAVQQRHQQR